MDYVGSFRRRGAPLQGKYLEGCGSEGSFDTGAARGEEDVCGIEIRAGEVESAFRLHIKGILTAAFLCMIGDAKGGLGTVQILPALNVLFDGIIYMLLLRRRKTRTLNLKHWYD